LHVIRFICCSDVLSFEDVGFHASTRKEEKSGFSLKRGNCLENDNFIQVGNKHFMFFGAVSSKTLFGGCTTSLSSIINLVNKTEYKEMAVNGSVPSL
jgi:hypothetical protein